MANARPPHWLDRLVSLTLPAGTWFRDGWGDERIIEGTAPEEAAPLPPPPPIEIAWEREERFAGLRVRDGSFESPEARLPAPVRRARVRLVEPAGGAGSACLHLASSGEQGYSRRARFARPLVGAGIAAALLEQPYYGSRRPPGQQGVSLRTVSDLILMGAAAVREGRALLGWLRAAGFERVGVSGFSMGGQMAAAVAASLPFPVAAAPLAPSDSPAFVFAEGLLRAYPRWRSLGGPDRPAEEARLRLRDLLARFAVTRMPPPRAPGAAVIVGAADDGFVSPGEVRRIAAHWKGAELRWVAGGHASAFLFAGDAMRRAIADAFERLGAARP
jgi:pimeloyl-ACP methyl ester carboxylesterase